MKSITLLSVITAVASAVPLGDSASEGAQLEARQLGTTRTDLEDGDAANCPSAILIYARGSTEPGNMVRGPHPISKSRCKTNSENDAGHCRRPAACGLP